MFAHIMLGFGISFVGSLPVGVLGITAMELAVTRKFHQVLLFALGAVTVEYGQAYLAIATGDYLLRNPALESRIRLLIAPIFLCIGLLYLYSGYAKRKAAERNMERKSFTERMPPVVKGLALSLLNPLAVWYWLVVSTALVTTGQLSTDAAYLVNAFICGIVSGTFAALVLYGVLGEVLRKYLVSRKRYFNTAIGCLFIILAVWQWWQW